MTTKNSQPKKILDRKKNLHNFFLPKLNFGQKKVQKEKIIPKKISTKKKICPKNFLKNKVFWLKKFDIQKKF